MDRIEYKGRAIKKLHFYVIRLELKALSLYIDAAGDNIVVSVKSHSDRQNHAYELQISNSKLRIPNSSVVKCNKR